VEGRPYWRRAVRLVASIAARRPSVVTLQVTNRCNMRCPFCAFWSDGAPPHDELTLAEIARVSERLAAVGSFIVSVEGGEPTLRPDLPEIIAELAREHHPVLYTNGWHVDAEYARTLWRAGLVGAGVSLDYADPARHDAHRLPGSHARALAAARALADAAPRGRRKHVHLMTVLMEDNVEELEPLLDLSRRLRVRHRVTLLALDGHNRASGKRRPPAGASLSSRLAALRRRHRHFADLSSYIDGIDPFLDGRFAEPCAAGRLGFNINHLGETNPCIEHTDVSVGRFLDAPTDEILERLAAEPSVRGCQKCYTLCRGHVQALANPRRIGPILQLLG
jgi:MoaA/NifB/PqqE/SkfB family radical SAM enzyme